MQAQTTTPVLDQTPRVPSRTPSQWGPRFELPCAEWYDSLLYFGYDESPHWSVRHHYHEHFEVCIVVGGAGNFWCQNRFFPARKGSVFLTKPGEGHWGHARSEEPFAFYFCGFRVDSLNNLEKGYYSIGAQRIAHDSTGFLEPICRTMVEEAQTQPPFHIAMLKGLFIQLLAGVLRLYQVPEEETGALSGFSPPIRTALELLHLNHAISLQEVAQRVDMSKSHLAREFKRQVGMSMGQYVRALRLDHARWLLRESDLSVSAIAQQLQFASIQSFSMSFKNYAGVSPQKYRLQSRSYAKAE